MPTNKAYDDTNGDSSTNNQTEKPPQSSEAVSTVDDDQTLILNAKQTYFAEEKILIPDIDKVRKCFLF